MNTSAPEPSVVTPKPASHGHPKTGQRSAVGTSHSYTLP
jgi:hypothetical protein